MRPATSEPLEPLKTQAGRMASLARPDRSEPIVVLGPGALALAMELCRDGFQEVVCGGRFGPPCTMEHSSTVLISGPASEEELRPLLRDACSILRRQGRLVLRLSSIDQDRAVETLLASLDVRIKSAVYDLSREVLVCHHLESAVDKAMTPSVHAQQRAA